MMDFVYIMGQTKLTVFVKMAIQAIHVRKVNYIIQLFCHCIVMWYAMSQSLVKLKEIGTS